MPYVNRDLTRTGLFRKETERKLLQHEWFLAIVLTIAYNILFVIGGLSLYLRNRLRQLASGLCLSDCGSHVQPDFRGAPEHDDPVATTDAVRCTKRHIQ